MKDEGYVICLEQDLKGLREVMCLMSTVEESLKFTGTKISE